MGLLGEFGELILPRRCAGCGGHGHLLCPVCRHQLASPPFRHSPNMTAHVPVYALGPYADPHRGVVLAMKEHNNVAVRRHVGAVIAAALDYLEARGDIPAGIHLVPAPTRPRSARARGGDPVTAICAASGRPTHAVLALPDRLADQAGLDESGRRRNLQGNVILTGVPRQPVVVVDDVVTTGATLQSSVEKLMASGASVAACLVLCAA
nr:DNA utilization protein GntX [Streptococcus thermophilus]